VVVAILCLAEILSMLPFSMFLALQPRLQEAWALSNTESGWISSAYFAGYMVAVPVLSSLTDRVDARSVWLGACAMAVGGAVGFAWWANGVWSAAALQMVAGAALAGTYMPGLKVIADRLPRVPGPRHVAFYTTSFTAGSSVSFWIIGAIEPSLSWRTAVLLTAAGPVAAWLLVAVGLRRVRVTAASHLPPATHWRAVFGSADTMRYVVGYAAHTWELFALRAWIVPFVTFCVSVREVPPPFAAATIAAAVAIIGVPASIAGAEVTTRIHRRRLIVMVMLGSVAVSLIVLPSALMSWPLGVAAVLAYSWFISADSASLTSGILHVAPVASRGTAMAVYSTLGFASASAGTFAVGALLDLMGGQSAASWGVAFALMSVPNIVGAWAIARTERGPNANTPDLKAGPAGVSTRCATRTED
jgi:MFS family permease